MSGGLPARRPSVCSPPPQQGGRKAGRERERRASARRQRASERRRCRRRYALQFRFVAHHDSLRRLLCVSWASHRYSILSYCAEFYFLSCLFWGFVCFVALCFCRLSSCPVLLQACISRNDSILELFLVLSVTWERERGFDLLRRDLHCGVSPFLFVPFLCAFLVFNRLFVCHAPVSSRIRDIIEIYILLLNFGHRSFVPFWTIIFQFYLFFGVRSWTNLCFATCFCIPHAFRAEFPARTTVENIIIIACDDAFILFKESFQICHLLFSVIPACQAVFFVCLYALRPPGGPNFVYVCSERGGFQSAIVVSVVLVWVAVVENCASSCCSFQG